MAGQQQQLLRVARELMFMIAVNKAGRQRRVVGMTADLQCPKALPASTARSPWK